MLVKQILITWTCWSCTDPCRSICHEKALSVTKMIPVTLVFSGI